MKRSIYIGIIILVISSIFITSCTKNTDNNSKVKETKKVTTKAKSVLEHEYYKGLTLDDVTELTILHYTEAGVDEKTYTDQETIDKNYNYWMNKKLGSETQKACDDNTTIYVFKLKDNATISIEQECDWVVINNKRYLIR